MSTLDSIVAAILRDVTRAQDIANRHAAKLAEHYRYGAALESMPVPRAVAKEVELDLRFAFGEPAEQPAALSHRVSHRASWIALRPALRDLCAWIALEAKFEAVASDSVVDSLASAAAHAVVAELSVHPPAGESLVAMVVFVVRKQLLALAPLHNHGALVDAAIRRVDQSLLITLDAIRAASDALREESSIASLPVLLDVGSLAAVDEQRIQHIKIKAELRSHRWVVVDAASGDVRLVDES